VLDFYLFFIYFSKISKQKLLNNRIDYTVCIDLKQSIMITFKLPSIDRLYPKFQCVLEDIHEKTIRDYRYDNGRAHASITFNSYLELN
jgi:hypothetical protein